MMELKLVMGYIDTDDTIAAFNPVVIHHDGLVSEYVCDTLLVAAGNVK